LPGRLRREDAPVTAQLSADSRVRFHPLATRPDGAEWIVGRPATGEFVAVPAEAIALLEALGNGATIADAKRTADQSCDGDIDALDFVADLVELGFVAAVDDQPVPADPVRPPSLPWLRPRHVAWLFGAPAVAGAAVLMLAGAVAQAMVGFPGYSAFFAVRWPGLNLALLAAIGLAILALHELSHLAAARAAGVPGWFGLGTRMFFLVAQTSVPGLWMAGRSIRLRVFAAGMISDLLVWSGACMILALARPHGTARGLLGQVALVALIGVLEQFAFCLRTDVFLVVQELAGCKNLHADALGYLGYLVRRRPGAADPLLVIPAAERRAVRLYAPLMAGGCAVIVALTAGYALPLDIGTISRAVHEIASGLAPARPAALADGAAGLVVLAAFQVLLAVTLLRTYGSRLRILLDGQLRRPRLPA
jgi:putative peptide zinc metalloprotease protein